MPRRLIFWVIGAILSLGLLLCGLAGVLLCEGALHPPRRPVPSNSSARNVQVTARDGAVLRAWLFKAEKPHGDAVLILHGIADSRASQRGLARMFVDHGYAALVPDSRAHGESGGDLATYGLLESNDVHGWVSWLFENERPRRVFGIGESLGGAVLIESLQVEPRFSAVVADSAFASFEPRGTSENRPSVDTSKAANGVEPEQEYLYPGDGRSGNHFFADESRVILTSPGWRIRQRRDATGAPTQRPESWGGASRPTSNILARKR